MSLAAAFLICLGAAAHAQVISPARLKAAFIWNFAKFTEWPADAVRAGEPFVMCVVGNAVVADALEDAVEGRLLRGHDVRVSHTRAGEPRPAVCHVLFISGLASRQVSEILKETRDMPVLSISDVDGAPELGVIIHFVDDRGQLGFRVQRESASRARLQVSSLLLTMSR